MSFVEEMQQKHNQEKLDQLAYDIKCHAEYRYHKVNLQKGVDVKHKWIFSYQLIGYGQLVWDRLVEMGFKPHFTWGGDWGGGAGIYIRW
jgi:hypothetical protein